MPLRGARQLVLRGNTAAAQIEQRPLTGADFRLDLPLASNTKLRHRPRRLAAPLQVAVKVIVGARGLAGQTGECRRGLVAQLDRELDDVTPRHADSVSWQ